MPPRDSDPYYFLDAGNVDPARMKKEREKARKLRKSQWWLDLVNRGECHYCQKKFRASELTMDHVVPLARGGESTKGNIVPACRDCNRDKKLETPAERILREMNQSKEGAPEGNEDGSDGS